MTSSVLTAIAFCNLFTFSYSLVLNCTVDTDCSSTTQTCDAGTNCTVLCGDNSCRYTVIESNYATTLNIFCSFNLACVNITINCQTTPNGCILNCSEIDSCGSTSLTCGTGDCILDIYLPSNDIIVNATLSSNYACTGEACDYVELYTASPTVSPTTKPSYLPTVLPTYNPSYTPTYIPSIDPSSFPTYLPSEIPSSSPIFTSDDIQNGTRINPGSNSSYNFVVWIVSGTSLFAICLIGSAVSLWSRKKREGLHAIKVHVTPGSSLFTMESTSSNIYSPQQLSYKYSRNSIPYFSNFEVVTDNTCVELPVIENTQISDVQLSSNCIMAPEEPILNIDVNVECDEKLELQQALNENRISIDSGMNVMNRSEVGGYGIKGKIDCDNDNGTAGNIKNFDADAGNVNDYNFNDADEGLAEG